MMTKERQVKKEALTEVVYLMPMVPNMYMEVMQKDSRKAYFNISLWKFLKCL